MQKWVNSPKTTIGGLIAVVALACMWTGKMNTNEAMTILGIAAIWIGVSAKDTNK
jgi:hypothetical protein